jgi:hypothetical protein
MRLPADAFVEIEPVKRVSDGRLLKRFYLKGNPELVFTEDPMDQLFEAKLIEVKPMDMPTGGIFFLNYEYGIPSKARPTD